MHYCITSRIWSEVPHRPVGQDEVKAHTSSLGHPHQSLHLLNSHSLHVVVCRPTHPLPIPLLHRLADLGYSLFPFCSAHHVHCADIAANAILIRLFPLTITPYACLNCTLHSCTQVSLRTLRTPPHSPTPHIPSYPLHHHLITVHTDALAYSSSPPPPVQPATHGHHSTRTPHSVSNEQRCGHEVRGGGCAGGERHHAGGRAQAEDPQPEAEDGVPVERGVHPGPARVRLERDAEAEAR
ncbi:hypothetical protein Q4I30_002554, partial [Leishmania utingensis]